MEAVIEMNENICSKNVHVFSVKDKRDKLNYRWQVILRQTSSLTDDLLFWQQCVHECVHGHLKECYLGTVQNYLELSISAAWYGTVHQRSSVCVCVGVWMCVCVFVRDRETEKEKETGSSSSLAQRWQYVPAGEWEEQVMKTGRLSTIRELFLTKCS